MKADPLEIVAQPADPDAPADPETLRRQLAAVSGDLELIVAAFMERRRPGFVATPQTIADWIRGARWMIRKISPRRPNKRPRPPLPDLPAIPSTRAG
jgi:hypothetical protein